MADTVIAAVAAGGGGTRPDVAGIGDDGVVLRVHERAVRRRVAEIGAGEGLDAAAVGHLSAQDAGVVTDGTAEGETGHGTPRG